MSDLFSYQPPAARRTDPETSKQAGALNRENDRRQALLIHATHPDGLTDFELAALMGRQQTSAGKRRGELRDLGLIHPLTIAGEKITRPAPSGAPARVWTITYDGMQEANRLKANG